MIFFTISGYLVAQSRSSRRRPLRFSCARGLRIYPSLLAPVFITIFLIGFPISVYHSALPFQQLIARVWPGVSAQDVFVLAMIFTLPLACLSWHLIEKPALTLKP